ncbi:type II restriction endonuclease [Taylorella equigenitalis 14/56]|uniref:Type II restriction endonuclease n=1 Tax=Taylorella equigenitalis 14/56 TaxID=1091497 RepID=I7JK21_9BURK|nr:HaeIII family restriction endonuclease [Taylorella equigenitalis]CCG18208.1 type II restriction endonuclease [Taylorella equigenitalis 14/56]
MSGKNDSNNSGRAFEYTLMHVLYDSIRKYRNVDIVEDNSYFTNYNAWTSLKHEDHIKLTLGALAFIDTLFKLEPILTENSKETVYLSSQNDTKGKVGDVRDIVISIPDINWQIGISAKRNHSALKHSRLSKTLDFGNAWYKVPCSQEYWNEIDSVFKEIELLKQNCEEWKNINNKKTNFYVPLLNAFKREIIKVNNEDKNFVHKLFSYLIGFEDYYKVLSMDKKEKTYTQVFNFNGTLNVDTGNIPTPTKLLEIDFKENNNTTLLMKFDNNWEFSFRIHNSSRRVDTSLKFDINLIHAPQNFIEISSNWDLSKKYENFYGLEDYRAEKTPDDRVL